MAGTSAPHHDPRDALKLLLNEEELQADLHSLLAHRSSAPIPDYTNVRSLCSELMEGVPQALEIETFDRECTRLRERLKIGLLRSSCVRAFNMLKLAASYLDHRNIPNAFELAFGPSRSESE